MQLSKVAEELCLSGSRRLHLALAVTICAILAVTLFPSGGEKDEPMLRCLVCGERGVADVILNVLLFMPFGAALSLAGVRLRRICLDAAVLSAVIELAQLFIPGRDSSLSDVLSNTTGATAGCLVVWQAPRVIRLQGLFATLGALAAAALTVLVTAGTGLLLRPAFPASVYYGQWTPNLEHLEWYGGRVLEAQLGSIALPPRRLANSEAARQLLVEGAPLSVRATAGPEVSRLASLVSIADDRQREIALLGLERQALVFRYRTRSTAWRLDQPDLRVPDALAPVAPGDTFAVALWREPTGTCLALNGARTCRLGFTAGRGWAIVLYPESLAPWLMRLLDVGWVAGVLIPVGFCAHRRPALWAGGSLLAGLGLAPALTGLLSTPAGDWVGGLVGVLVGIKLRALVSRRSAIANGFPLRSRPDAGGRDRPRAWRGPPPPSAQSPRGPTALLRDPCSRGAARGEQAVRPPG